MGYTTDFDGKLTLSKPLTHTQFDFLSKFSDTRRMKRNVEKLMELHKGKGGYPGKTLKNTPEEIYGIDGAYFVGGGGSFGQDNDASVIDHNIPPGQLPYSERDKEFNRSYAAERALIDSGNCQPGLWCQWIVENDGADGSFLLWDGGEKFYEYIAWLRYLIAHFFTPWKVKLNGEITWVGEDDNDRGKIVVKDNVVTVFEGTTVYNETED